LLILRPITSFLASGSKLNFLQLALLFSSFHVQLSSCRRVSFEYAPEHAPVQSRSPENDTERNENSRSFGLSSFRACARFFHPP